MKILAEYGRDDLAKVYVAQMREHKPRDGKGHRYCIECVESIQPPIPRMDAPFDVRCVMREVILQGA
jgi:hypothetical protein